MKMDIDRELAALDSCLAEMTHPLPPTTQERALDVAAGIVAGSRPADRDRVATRLETMLLRHGLTACCHAMPKPRARQPESDGLAPSVATGHEKPAPGQRRAAGRRLTANQ